MNLKALALLFVFCSLIASAYAADQYKPYLHKPTIPQHPEIKLYGEYSTNIYSGIAMYSYIIDTPKGVGGLEPTIGIYYNSESMKTRPSILGAGWSMNYNFIYRDVNSTPDDSSDDFFIMYLDGNTYELIYYNGAYHSKVEYYYRIENISNYWIVTKQDGTQYRFGYNPDSKLESNTGKSYTLRWALDLVEDSHENTMLYSYLKDPNSEDIGSQYLSNITYNSDELKFVEFSYESAPRPDRRRIYQQDNILEESRRLTDITIYVSDEFVKRDHLDYTTLNPSLSTISNIVNYGADNSSILYNISFEYYAPAFGYANTTQWTPPILFSNDSHIDYGSRLIDVNNDGLIDIVQSNGTINKIWINTNNTWILDSNWVLPINITNKTGYDQGVRFEDVNIDGLTDIIASKTGSQVVYLNNGNEWILSSWTVPIIFVNSSGHDQGVNIADINNDGKPDIVQALGGTRSVYLNTGNGWTLDSSWSVPADFISSANNDTGVRIVDINGDGLPDIVRSSTSAQNIWINTGSNWSIDNNWAIPISFTLSNDSDAGARFVDADSDGLVDILSYANGSSSKAYLNNGSGWYQDDSWASPEPFTSGGHNIGKRLADVNGDGFADIIVSHQDSGHMYTLIKNHTIPYMLKSIKNEYGGIVTINYTSSTQFNNTINGTSQLGFNIYVVDSVTKNNSIIGNLNVIGNISYNYSLGVYDYKDKEFRGFGIVTEHYPSKIIGHHFYQDDARKGKEHSTIIYDNNWTLFSRKDTGYEYILDNGIYNLSITYMTDYLYDGNIIPVVNNKSFFYNRYGNYEYIIDWGDSNIFGDERYYNYSYAINTRDWIVNKLARESVYDNSLKVRETKYYYDELGLTGVSSIGDLTKKELWNSNGNNSFTYYEYDNVGNLISATDNYGNTDKYTYEITNTYPKTTINALGHITYYGYNLSTGNLMWIEKNGIRTTYDYDTFGRVYKEILPYDSAELPTKKYVYDFDGVAPEIVTVKQRTSADKTFDTTYLYDGFSNLIQSKTFAENDLEIVNNIFYDSEFMTSAVQNPYFDEYTYGLSDISSANYTYYKYDALGRVIRVINPDGTNNTVIFNQRNVTEYNANNNNHMYTLDSHGRISNVYEHNIDPYINISETYVTTYSYDGNDNLILIVDNKENRLSFNYDSLGKKISMSDPDMGNWSYYYDLNGNLIKQTDNRGVNIILSYDRLNRIVSKNSTNANTLFYYDEQYYGTLSRIINNNDSISYTYDKRMRPIIELQNIDGFNVSSESLYDSADRVVSRDGLNYIYNTQGNLKSISGYVNSTYNAFGAALNRTYNNGLVQKYTYNNENNRIEKIFISNVMDLEYSYDNVGNIISINDSVNSLIYSMSYDDLDRMINVAIGDDSYSYSYNSLGNIMKRVKNDVSKKYVYEGLAHAPSSIIDGRSGVDVYTPNELDSSSKNRTFEFFIINDNIESISANVSVNFGDEVLNFNDISVDSNVMFLVQKNYSHGGTYVVNISANSPGISDRQSLDVKFGLYAGNLSIIYSNVSERIFEFDFGSDIVENSYNVSWNCSNGINSFVMNLSSLEYVMDFIVHNYSSPGPKNFICIVMGVDGNDTSSIEFNVDGLKITEYDVLYNNISRRIVGYDLKNYYHSLSTNITMIGDDTSSLLANVSSNEEILVFAEFNYSNDNNKNLNILISANGSTDNYKDTFTYKGASIRNYNRISKNYTINVLMFDVFNNWNSGFVNWAVGEPNIQNATYLSNGESVMVFIENNYTNQGDRKPEINATTSNYVDRIKEFFEIRPVKIVSLLTLQENRSNSISESVIKNNLNTSKYVSWNFNTGLQNISSSTTLNATESIFVFVASNYSSNGVHKTSISTNTTAPVYTDSETGVIII